MELALLLQHCIRVYICIKFLHAVVVADGLVPDDDDAVNVGLWMLLGVVMLLLLILYVTT